MEAPAEARPAVVANKTGMSRGACDSARGHIQYPPRIPLGGAAMPRPAIQRAETGDTTSRDTAGEAAAGEAGPPDGRGGNERGSADGQPDFG